MEIKVMDIQSPTGWPRSAKV